MSSIEFLLANLTAQTNDLKPRVQGNKPEFSAAFIAQCVGRIPDWVVYHAAMAKYCDDEIATHELNVCMEKWAWLEAGRKYPARSFKRADVGRVAELAVLFFLNPAFEYRRKVSQCAAFVGVAPKTWESKYNNIRTMIIHELAELQSAANRQIRLVMTDKENIQQN